MRFFGLIPAKRLSRSKMRLSSILNSVERRLFTLAMLEDVIETLRSSRWIDETIVIGTDVDVIRLSDKMGVTFMEDVGIDLNDSLKYATRLCICRGAEALLIVPSDLPLITPEDIDRMFHLSLKIGEPSVIISPSKDGGTNALLRRPPDIIDPSFGPKSFRRHKEQAKNKGVRIEIYDSVRTSLDIDSVGDLIRFIEIGGEEKASYKLLRKLRIDLRLSQLCQSLPQDRLSQPDLIL